MNITTVIFDIDGTLYNNATALCSAPLVHLRSILWILRYGKMRKSLRAYYSNDLNKNIKITHDDFWKKSIALFSQQNSYALDKAEYLLEKHIYSMWINASAQVPLRLGMRKLIGDLYRANIKLGILSDFRAEKKISQWGLNQYFDVIISGEDEGILKPNPAVFLRCCKYMNCNPLNAAYVGNHFLYDGLGAKKAGLISVLFTQKKDLARMHGIIPISSVQNLRNFLL